MIAPRRGKPPITRLLAYLAALTLINLQAPSALADCHDNAIEITSDDRLQGAVVFNVTTHRITEATVSFDCRDLQNLKPSQPLPMVFAVTRPYQHTEFLRLSQIERINQWHWGKYNYKFVIGIASRLPTTDYVYSLPYSQHDHFTIGQSYFGTFTHYKGSPEEYAVDIVMPEGTPVMAARPGIVVGVRDDSNMGGPTEEFKECFNYVYIKHDDGTYGAYIHLRYKGVIVQPGQPVAAGTTLGYSGQTGWVTEPHLHFTVFRVQNGANSKSLPFRTRTPAGIVDQLMEGETY